jgi:DNA repair protein RecN (Recombination protein N)
MPGWCLPPSATACQEFLSEMLTELRIENFAIIQRLELSFGTGLLAFTGETGAGKSILLDAITALVGGPFDAAFIRSGADRAALEAVFHLPSGSRADLLEVLEREGLLEEGSADLTLGRELRREGRSVARINGRAVAIGLLREVGSYLVDIHGQSEHLSLLNVKQHLALLDRYAGSDDLLAAYKKTYAQLSALRRELKALREMEDEAQRRTDLLNFQAGEIEAARLQDGEDEALKQERSRLANAETLATAAQTALALLEESASDVPSITDLMGELVQSVHAIARVDEGQAGIAEQAETLADSAADLARDLRAYLEAIEFNPRRLAEVEERLNLIHLLLRKYGGSIPSALAFAADARRQLDQMANAGERIVELEADESRLLAQLAEQAAALTQSRRAAGERLGSAVERELADLSMAGARFAVDMQHKPDPHGLLQSDGSRAAFDASGADVVEFLIAPNPGEGLKPLVKIASGGETSRLMLALKNVLAQADYVPTLIFDEIDQGIGGRVGAVVGEKLWQLGRTHQVMCVTHLPQLAAFGDQHYHVRKQVDGGRTTTIVETLEGPRRVEELAAMLGSDSDVNRVAAAEALALARERAAALSTGKSPTD